MADAYWLSDYLSMFGLQVIAYSGVPSVNEQSRTFHNVTSLTWSIQGKCVVIHSDVHARSVVLKTCDVTDIATSLETRNEPAFES